MTTRSHSGQFILAASREASAASILIETNRECLRLAPLLLPVSCERIKQAVWRELGVTGAWRGKIFLSLCPAQTPDDEAFLRAERFMDGWQYRVELPEVVNRARYVRAIVQVVLLELANREARDHAAELPPWLAEGVTQELLGSPETAVFLPPPTAVGSVVNSTALNPLPIAATQFNTRKRDPLDPARKILSLRAPLTYDQLSWPAPDAWDREGGEVFQASSHVFVSELQRLKNGRASLRAMVEALPRYYNWQFAFLEAFHESFQSALDVEKWWTLRLAQFTGRELGGPLPPDESLVRLDEVLRHPIKVRIGTNEVPFGAEASLQTVIREWGKERQTLALEAKLRELAMARPRVAPDMAPLVDEYRQVIATFLEQREPAGFVLPFRKGALRRQAVEAAVARLDALDKRRQSMGQIAGERAMPRSHSPARSHSTPGGGS